jgi:hypothetical protein
MIFINGKKANRLDEDKLALLEKRFPRFFDKQSPKPVTLFFTAQYKQKGVRGIPGRRVYSQVDLYPPPYGVKCIKNVPNDGGTFDEVVYTSQTPKIKNGEIKWGMETKMDIMHGMALYPKKDTEKLYFLYFYSGLFDNGFTANQNAVFTFSSPEATSASRIEAARHRARLENEVLLSGKSYDMVKKVLVALDVDIDGAEEVDRTNLYDFLVANPKYIGTYDEICKGDSNIADAAKLVREAMECGALICDEEGWKLVGKAGAGRVIVPKAADEPELSFAKYVSENKETATRILTAMEKVSAKA